MLLVAAPGCLMGSPLAAISGEPYGMVIDDVQAIRGRSGRIWSDAPFAAVIDIPFAFVLDTAFLPVSAIIWSIKAIAGGSSADETTSRRDLEERRERRRRAATERINAERAGETPDDTNE
jgi:uncharacterized protein YceK